MNPYVKQCLIVLGWFFLGIAVFVIMASIFKAEGGMYIAGVCAVLLMQAIILSRQKQ